MSTRRRHDDDRALGAVERVRRVREQDSRIGLQQALATTAQHAAAVAAARMLMETRPQFSHGSVRDFHADRALLAAMAQQHERERQRAESSRRVAEEAQRRWHGDRAKVRAVEMLLERRGEERRVESDRREAAELDDLAAQGWLRQQKTTPTRGNDHT